MNADLEADQVLLPKAAVGDSPAQAPFRKANRDLRMCIFKANNKFRYLISEICKALPGEKNAQGQNQEL